MSVKRVYGYAMVCTFCTNIGPICGTSVNSGSESAMQHYQTVGRDDAIRVGWRNVNPTAKAEDDRWLCPDCVARLRPELKDQHVAKHTHAVQLVGRPSTAIPICIGMTDIEIGRKVIEAIGD